MDTKMRLGELIERFERESARKCEGLSTAGARILYYKGFQPSWQREPILPKYQIAYFYRDGSFQHAGAVLGSTRAAAIMWLLRHFKQWGEDAEVDRNRSGRRVHRGGILRN